MNKNLIKILSTIGLIVAIALILKGVFGIGKLGINNLTNNNIIKFDKCYDPEEVNNHKEHIAAADFESWTFDIDLLKNSIIRTIVWKDERIKTSKEKNNLVIPKVELDNFYIESKTNDYVKSGPLGETMGKGSFYTFFLKSGKMQLYVASPSGKTKDFIVNFNCKIY